MKNQKAVWLHLDVVDAIDDLWEAGETREDTLRRLLGLSPRSRTESLRKPRGRMATKRPAGIETIDDQIAEQRLLLDSPRTAAWIRTAAEAELARLLLLKAGPFDTV